MLAAVVAGLNLRLLLALLQLVDWAGAELGQLALELLLLVLRIQAVVAVVVGILEQQAVQA
jgi:hypothetical protein